MSVSGNKTWTRPTLSIEELKHLKMVAPHLKTLTLDLSRTPQGPWPTNELKVLSTYDNLKDLTLNFEPDEYSQMREADYCFDDDGDACKYPNLMQPPVERNATECLSEILRRGQRSRN